MAEAKIVVNGREYPLPDSFTMGELADMEEITGQSYDLSKGGIKGTLALAYIAVRRVNPSVTVDDIRNLAPDDLDISSPDEEEVNPPSPGA